MVLLVQIVQQARIELMFCARLASSRPCSNPESLAQFALTNRIKLYRIFSCKQRLTLFYSHALSFPLSNTL